MTYNHHANLLRFMGIYRIEITSTRTKKKFVWDGRKKKSVKNPLTLMKGEAVSVVLFGISLLVMADSEARQSFFDDLCK